MSGPQELADRLLGTCEQPSIEELEALTAAELAEFDALVFCCDGCSWWCEVGEAHEGPSGADVCGDCHVEEDEE